MAITPENITRHELIGLQAEVTRCTDSQKEGISGEVLDETRETLNIDGKTVIKQNCRFLFELPNGEEVEIDGEQIKARPEDRTNL